MMKPRAKLFLIGFSIAAMTGFFFYQYIQFMQSNFGTPAERGQFGDMFGAVNAFIQFIAFLVIATNLFFLRKQIENQEKEIDHLRNESRKDDAEKKFYYLIDLYEKGIEKLRLPDAAPNSNEVGRDSIFAFVKVAKRIHEHLLNAHIQNGGQRDFDAISASEISASFFTDQRITALSRLMNILYQAVLSIRGFRALEDNRFIEILKVILSPTELGLLGYYVLHKDWQSQEFVYTKVGVDEVGAEHLIHPNHKAFFEGLNKLTFRQFMERAK